MAKYETRVKTRFGEIVFGFDTTDELKSKVEAMDFDVVSDILWRKFGSVIPTEIRKPKPGFENLYTFTLSGLIEPVQIPDALTKPEIIGFVLFAYHPEAATARQIFLSSGIKNVASDYLTHPSYKKFWARTQEGAYVLSDEGLKWVFSKIVPKLKTVNKPEEKTLKKST